MSSVVVVYFSGAGHTHLMAEAVAAGASQVSGTTAKLLRITGDQIKDGRWKQPEFLETLSQADAIVFGSPTYMGGVAAQFKAFIDGASEIWFAQGWKNKIAGGFTHSGSLSGDKQGTLLYLATNAAQHGMVWIGFADLPSSYFGKTDGLNRLGSFLGVMGQSNLDMSGNPAEIDPGDRLSAERYGQRIAEAAQRWTA
ncbi:MAG: flavodoxin family protein [Oscillatoriophycideae cyanobacterium NC_groundwater_1537_Pr4_S-0.65um_50_18]|nr:flavodoxin family protein [Oscillatoriophycideae cyanobacterium NC_groundwater_1537_Pr4_S-0.65um_50_18]